MRLEVSREGGGGGGLTVDPSGPAAAAGLKVRLEESREEGGGGGA